MRAWGAAGDAGHPSGFRSCEAHGHLRLRGQSSKERKPTWRCLIKTSDCFEEGTQAVPVSLSAGQADAQGALAAGAPAALSLTRKMEGAAMAERIHALSWVLLFILLGIFLCPRPTRARTWSRCPTRQPRPPCAATRPSGWSQKLFSRGRATVRRRPRSTASGNASTPCSPRPANPHCVYFFFYCSL